MAIQTRNRLSTEFSTASMSDLVFLLLIFFVMTSTLVSPNVIPLLLPNSKSPNPIEVQTVTVYIDGTYNYFIDPKSNPNPIAEGEILGILSTKLTGLDKANIVLRADKTVPVQNIVTVIDAVNQINEAQQTNFKVILATESK